MAKTRRSFTDEFKQEAVALLESSGRPLQQVAAELGIQPSMLRHWRRRGEQPGGTPRPPSAPAASRQAVEDQAAELARLRRENANLRMQRDILKNALHFLGTAEMRFRIMADCQQEYPVRVMCEACR